MFSLGLMSMRALQWLLVLGCIASIASAVNGVQSFSYDSATGSHTAYFAGWDRLWAVASALATAHRRSQPAKYAVCDPVALSYEND